MIRPFELYHWGIEQHTYDAVGVWEWKRIKSDCVLARDDDAIREYILDVAKNMGIYFTDESEWEKDDWEYQDIRAEDNYRIYFWDTEFDDIYEFGSGFQEDIFEQLLNMVKDDVKVLSSTVYERS